MTDRDVEEFLAIRRKAAQHIDPETAEVERDYGMDADPYGIDRDLPEELQQVARIYFARSPGSDIWVWFGDLPETVRLAVMGEARRRGHACSGGGPALASPQSWISIQW
jgi:hypothetical protein